MPASPPTSVYRTKRCALTLAAASLFLLTAPAAYAQTTLLSQNFDTFTTGSTTDYYTVNNSNNANATLSWQQPDAATVTNEFSSYNGSSTSYVYSNYEDIASGSGTISAWLITPTLTYQNGDVVSFYTRTTGFTPIYPDRLQVLLSTSGTSTNVGTQPADVGDFSTLLLDINPSQTIAGYPSTWTQYTATISGLSAATSGRVAFRYYVTDGGPGGTNSDYIGLDALTVTRVTSAAAPEPSSLGLLALGALPLVGLHRRRRSAPPEASA